jgi:hypothetical protein
VCGGMPEVGSRSQRGALGMRSKKKCSVAREGEGRGPRGGCSPHAPARQHDAVQCSAAKAPEAESSNKQRQTDRIKAISRGGGDKMKRPAGCRPQLRVCIALFLLSTASMTRKEEREDDCQMGSNAIHSSLCWRRIILARCF